MFSYEIALNYWEVFLLILVRITAFVTAAPFFSMANAPARVKIALSFFISIIVFMLIPTRTLEYNGIVDLAVLIVKEVVVGLLLGFSANLAMLTVSFAGYIIDINVGLSMATVFDPSTHMQTSVSGTLYYNTVYLLLLVSGLYQFLISAIVDSYQIIPIGEVTVNATLYDSFLGAVVDYFIVGFRIALPVFVTIMIVNVVLGVLTRVAPQLNMFAIGMQAKLIVGLAVMYLVAGMLPSITGFLLDMMKNAVVNIAGGLT